MRKYTLLLSITCHVAAAFTLLIAPIFAAAQLPGIRESIAWVPARVATPPALGDPGSTKAPSRRWRRWSAWWGSWHGPLRVDQQIRGCTPSSSMAGISPDRK